MTKPKLAARLRGLTALLFLTIGLQGPVHGQACDDVPDVISTSHTVLQATQDAAVDGRGVVLVRVVDNSDGRHDGSPVIGQYPGPNDEVTEGRAMHLFIPPQGETNFSGSPSVTQSVTVPETACTVLTVAALLEFFLIVVLIFLLVLLKKGQG